MVQSTEVKIENLEDWFEEFGDRYMCCLIKPSSGEGYEISKYFILEEFLEGKTQGIEETEDHQFYETIVPIENFRYDKTDNSCKFSISNTFYEFYFKVEPTDKWGNTASYEEGVDFKNPDCRTIYYSDVQTWELYDFVYPAFIEDNDLEFDFSDWFKDNHFDYEFISEVENKDYCEMLYCGFSYGTTNKPFSSKEWQELFADFKVYWQEVLLSD